LIATNTQAAIDELDGRIDNVETNINTNINNHITNTNNPHHVTAIQSAYSNTSSGLIATNTQAAIDELDGRIDTEHTSEGVHKFTDNTTSINYRLYIDNNNLYLMEL
jgi:methionine synthase I (cobalamin-dependent)